MFTVCIDHKPSTAREAERDRYGCGMITTQRDWTTFEQAERSAHALVRRHHAPATIHTRREIKCGRFTRSEHLDVATVRMDADERVWTDLSAEGARLI
jgi:hypothetical protein